MHHYVSATNNIRVAYEAKANRAVFDYLNEEAILRNAPDSFRQTLATAQTNDK